MSRYAAAGVGTQGVLFGLKEEIRLGGLRLNELNNKIQAVNMGGTRRLENRDVLRYIARTMAKRDRAEETQRILHLAYGMILRLHTAIAADAPDWTSPFDLVAQSHQSESGR